MVLLRGIPTRLTMTFDGGSFHSRLKIDNCGGCGRTSKPAKVGGSRNDPGVNELTENFHFEAEFYVSVVNFGPIYRAGVFHIRAVCVFSPISISNFRINCLNLN